MFVFCLSVPADLHLRNAENERRARGHTTHDRIILTTEFEQVQQD